jgi:hypothetical protein
VFVEEVSMRLLLIPVSCLLLQGCVAKIATDIVTAPIKIASKGVDLMTTSQAESDQNRGKALREQEIKLGAIARKRDKATKLCSDGNEKACAQAQELEEEYQRESSLYV